MVLEHLGQQEAAEAIMRAIEQVLSEGLKTPDIGGIARTVDVGTALAEAVLTA